MQFADVDAVKEAGHLVPFVKEFEHVPRVHHMLIQLIGVTENAFINGIEIYSGALIKDGALFRRAVYIAPFLLPWAQCGVMTPEFGD